METKISFWEEYQKRIGKKDLPTLTFAEQVLNKSCTTIRKAIAAFRNELAKIPIGAEIEHWLLQDRVQQKSSQYKICLLHLIDVGLLKITKDNGEIRTLNDITIEEHQWIIEEIRCIPNLSILEKEMRVEAYICFSQHISHITSRLILPGQNSDSIRTIKKVVLYSNFITFVQLLPDRDALIAKLLYFGAPTVEEVLNLTVQQVNEPDNLIRYREQFVEYPKHIILELKNFIKNKQFNELVFVNIKGEKVERTHLNNCFNRACSKLPSHDRITPRMLLKSDIKDSAASGFPFSGLTLQV